MPLKPADTSTRSWVDFLDTDPRLLELYSTFPAGPGARLQSLNGNRAGPTLLLRMDMSGFPDLAPPEWGSAGCDTLQLTVEFLAVDEFVASLPGLPLDVDITGRSVENRRALFSVTGEGLSIVFTAYERLRTGHVSAYRRPPPGEGAGQPEHHFLGRLDRRLYDSVPPPWREIFHAKL